MGWAICATSRAIAFLRRVGQKRNVRCRCHCAERRVHGWGRSILHGVMAAADGVDRREPAATTAANVLASPRRAPRPLLRAPHPQSTFSLSACMPSMPRELSSEHSSGRDAGARCARCAPPRSVPRGWRRLERQVPGLGRRRRNGERAGERAICRARRNPHIYTMCVYIRHRSPRRAARKPHRRGGRTVRYVAQIHAKRRRKAARRKPPSGLGARRQLRPFSRVIRPQPAPIPASDRRAMTAPALLHKRAVDFGRLRHNAHTKEIHNTTQFDTETHNWVLTNRFLCGIFVDACATHTGAHNIHRSLAVCKWHKSAKRQGGNGHELGYGELGSREGTPTGYVALGPRPTLARSVSMNHRGPSRVARMAGAVRRFVQAQSGRSGAPPQRRSGNLCRRDKSCRRQQRDLLNSRG